MLCGALFAFAHYPLPPLFSPILITFVLLAWNDVIGTTANAGIYIRSFTDSISLRKAQIFVGS